MNFSVTLPVLNVVVDLLDGLFGRLMASCIYLFNSLCAKCFLTRIVFESFSDKFCIFIACVVRPPKCNLLSPNLLSLFQCYTVAECTNKK